MARRGPSRPRQQSSLEFITTYSWALLIIALFVAVVAALALSPSPSEYLPAQCSITPLLPCLGSVLSYNATNPITFTMEFQNNLGQQMFIPFNTFYVITTGIGIAGTQYSIGSCSPNVLPSGTQAICTAQISGDLKPSSRTSHSLKFNFGYLLCGSNCSINDPLYRTVGTSLQRLSPPGSGFHTVRFSASSGGSIVVNGATYSGNTTTYLLGGNYSVFAQPHLGYVFSSWVVNAPSSVVSSTSQSTTLVLNSNTTLMATFNSVTPTTSVTYTTTGLSSSSSTTTSTSTTSPTSSTTVTTTSVTTSSTSVTTSTTSFTTTVYIPPTTTTSVTTTTICIQCCDYNGTVCTDPNTNCGCSYLCGCH